MTRPDPDPDWPRAALAPSTLAVHLGRPPVVPGGPVNPPIVVTSTYHQGGEATYGRDANPTWGAFETAVGGLEGGTARVFASGLGAIAAVVELVPTPGRVVVAADAYNGTRRFLTDVAARGRLRWRAVDTADTAATLQACAEIADGPGRPSGRAGAFGSNGLLWLESPTNPMLRVADLPELIAGAHDLGVDVAVDNTFATPLLQRPLEFGADVVVHSATKALSGHSDVLLGVAVSRRDDLVAALERQRSLHGAAPGPFEVWLALRGLRTLALRVERSQHNAGILALRLRRRTGVARVRYPGLADDPGHARAARQMTGFGAMIAFEMEAGAAAAEAVAGAVRIATAATSLGGVETLIEQRGRGPGEEALPPGLLRLSVGIEDVEDLWTDLDRALGVAADR